MEKCLSTNHMKIKEKLLSSREYNLEVSYASKIFSLLGETSRMKIVLALKEGELCVHHLCEITQAKQSATSQHLRKLKDGNIVKARKVNNQVLYSLADEHIITIVEMALKHSVCE